MPLAFDPSRRPRTLAAAALRRFVTEEDAQDLIEYAFLAAFIATAGYVALNGIVPAIGSTYTSWIDPNSGAPSLWQPADPWTTAGS